MKFIKIIIKFMCNTKKYILEGLLCFILYVCYKKIIGAHSALILIAIFALYAGSIVVSDFAKKNDLLRKTK